MVGRLNCLSIYLSHCWVLLLFFLYYCCVCLRDAWLMQMYQDTILHNITYMNVGWLLLLIFLFYLLLYHWYKMQFLSSFLFCPNSKCNLNWTTVLHCIFLLSSSPFCYFLSCIKVFHVLFCTSLLHHHHHHQYMCLCASFEWQDSRSFRKIYGTRI